MKGWQDDRGGDEYEGKDCWGCQQHINTHLAAGGDLRFLTTFFAFPVINRSFCVLKIVDFYRGKKKSARVVNHAAPTPCKIDAACLQIPSLI